MLTTTGGIFKMGSIELAEAPIGLSELRVLVTFLTAAPPASQPKDLYGTWNGSFPDSQDVDKAIKEIRRVSQQRLDIEPA